MKYLKFERVLTIVFTTLVSLILYSCDSDNTESPVKNKYYITTNLYPADSYIASLTLRLKDNSLTIKGLESDYRFVACATGNVSQNVTFTVIEDESLVEPYNVANGKKYKLLPAANYAFVNNKVTIKSGERVSSDSISIKLINIETLTAEDGFILPIKISSIEGATMNDISSNRKIVYVKVESQHINVESGQPTTGTLITDRSGWELKAAPTTRGDAKNLIDGTSSDVARDGGAEFWVTVDLGKLTTLTGIRNKCYSSSYSPTQVEVFKSTDGVKWKTLGIVTVSKSGTQYINFPKEVETRYLKYYVIAGSNTVSLTELDLYQK